MKIGREIINFLFSLVSTLLITQHFAFFQHKIIDKLYGGGVEYLLERYRN